jgi:polyphosphate kinase
LNCIAHLLSLIPYEEVPHEKIKFPKKQSKGKYVEPDYPYKRVPEKY